MAEDKPRYSRVSDIIDLATFMQSKVCGITIKDIEERYNVSRRTAIRMRDSLMNIFPSIIEYETDTLQKRWGFYNYSINELITFTSKEIANLEQLQRRTTNVEMKEELGKTVEKLKALDKKKLPKIENRVDLIMQTEGYAIRQMPQYKISTDVLNVIREAIQNSIKVTGIYHDKERLIEPLGMIYGEKIYLIAREKAKGDDIYTFLLHKFSDLKLTDESFDKQGFDLIKYSKQSFGVYHGEILNVKLSFDKERAEDALTYNFHPSQRVKLEDDGTVTVRFRASGSKEIIWHVFKWGKHCKILAPKKLRDEYKAYLKELL
ncbi:MAG: WYL domain-containing protein [Clostridiaceae bacterium]|jgi:predicted DNA-binding transcriptional regulator YafY|nr:WYL domain-containing protein [Clostridiaceae bacterium]